MKVITFNIRCANDKNGHSIDERAPRLKTVLDKYDADIVGFQEVTPHWFELIQRDYSADYCIFNKYRSKTYAPEAVTVMWKKNRFICLDKGYFWFSKTPWVESMGEDALYRVNRICQWVLLQDKETKKEFYYFNLHFGFGESYQIDSVNLIKDTINVMNAENVIITGDFNMTDDTIPYAEMTKYFSDVNKLTANFEGDTYHGYGLEKGSHIDYCFIRGDITPEKYTIIDDTMDGKYPSDHYGIMLELE